MRIRCAFIQCASDEVQCSVAPICKFADIPICRFLSAHTADIDADTDIYSLKINNYYVGAVLAPACCKMSKRRSPTWKYLTGSPGNPCAIFAAPSFQEAVSLSSPSLQRC